jgi:transcriptional regulator with XRE-family HTH domain
MLNEALRLIRVYHDVRQSEMAEKLGISKSYLSEIEHDRKRPTLDLVEKYAEIFKIPVSSIMFFSENMGKAGAYEKARGIVARKIISLMQFLEERAEKVDA